MTIEQATLERIRVLSLEKQQEGAYLAVGGLA